MNDIICTAPGKLFLSGEYAVLDGAEAVITAVDRRATARLAGKRARRSPITDGVSAAVTRYLETHLDRVEALPDIDVTSKGFSIDRNKLGLGSSAAVAACACGALFELAKLPIDTHRDAILEVATTGHRDAQKGKGSGADVATSVRGGTIVFTTSGTIESVPLRGIEIVPVWSGRSMSTKVMIERINAFQQSHPAAYRARFDRLCGEAARLADAYRRGDSQRIVSLTHEYGQCMKQFGDDADVPIVTPELNRIAAIAANLGGGAKPSGAGGGDVAIGVFENNDAASEFRTQCLRHGFRPLDLNVNAPGLSS